MIDLLNLDTTPGSGAPFAPPPGFTGDYRRWLQLQVHTDPGFRQRIVVSWQMAPDVPASGPEAMTLLEARAGAAAAFKESLDTSPESGRFAPLPTLSEPYLDWFRDMYRRDPEFRRALQRVSFWHPAPLAKGPHAASLQHAIERTIELAR